MKRTDQRKTVRPRRRRRAALSAALFCLAALVGEFVFAPAWTRTQQREAYLSDLEAQTRQTPRDADLQALLGARLAEAGAWESAGQALEKAAGDGAQDGSVWLTWAACNAALGRPRQAGAILRLGRRHAEAASAIQAALHRCRLLGAAPPPSVLAAAICPDGPNGLRQVYGSGSFLNAAAESWGRHHPVQSGFTTREQWAREQPNTIAVQILWVDALTRNRRQAEAQTAARRLVQFAPYSPDSHFALAEALYSGGAMVKAGLEYQKCLHLHPAWLPAEIGLGRVAVEKKMIPLAVRLFDQAAKQVPDSDEAWIGLGRAYYNEGLNLGKSVTAFQNAAQLSPNRTDFFPFYSDALAAANHLDLAEALLRRRLTAERADARSHYLLALILLKNNPTPVRQAEAETELRTSLGFAPNAPVVEMRLAQLLIDRDKYAQAGHLLESSLRGDPYSPLAMSLLGRAYFKLGQIEKAKIAQAKSGQLSIYQQAMTALQTQETAHPLNPIWHERLATLYRHGGQQTEADQEAQTASLLRTHTAASSPIASPFMSSVFSSGSCRTRGIRP